MKDESYTIRAQLGPLENPFSMTGIAGNATQAALASLTTTPQTGLTAPNPTVSSTTASATAPTNTTGKNNTASTASPTSASVPGQLEDGVPPSGLSTGTKAGIGVGVSLSALVALAIAVWTWKRKRVPHSRVAADTEPGRAELHGSDAKIHEAEVETYSKHELAGDLRPELGGNPRGEMDGRAMAEVPGIRALHEADGKPRVKVDTALP
jgi:hypothetical protein